MVTDLATFKETRTEAHTLWNTTLLYDVIALNGRFSLHQWTILWWKNKSMVTQDTSPQTKNAWIYWNGQKGQYFLKSGLIAKWAESVTAWHCTQWQVYGLPKTSYMSHRVTKYEPIGPQITRQEQSLNHAGPLDPLLTKDGNHWHVTFYLQKSWETMTRVWLKGEMFVKMGNSCQWSNKLSWLDQSVIHSEALDHLQMAATPRFYSVECRI